MSGLIGRKIGMTSVYDASGESVSCAVIEAGVSVVPQIETNQIEKIFCYKKYQFSDPTYLNNVLLIAGQDASLTPTVAQPIISYAANYYYNTAHGYANIYKHLTSTIGYVGFANYTAHRSETIWDVPSFTISQISSILNPNKYQNTVTQYTYCREHNVVVDYYKDEELTRSVIVKIHR